MCVLYVCMYTCIQILETLLNVTKMSQNQLLLKRKTEYVHIRYIYIYMFVCIFMLEYVYACIYAVVSIYFCSYIFICAYICVCMHVCTKRLYSNILYMLIASDNMCMVFARTHITYIYVFAHVLYLLYLPKFITYINICM